MSTRQHSCAWCGSAVERTSQSHLSNLCPECHETYEIEAHRSLHPVEERQPHND